MNISMIQNREKKIIHFILKEGKTRIKKIAEYMHMSEKTVSNSLKNIDSFLNEYNVAVIRKPNVGVYIDGDPDVVYQVLRTLDNQSQLISFNKEDRVIHIILSLLKSDDYLTIYQLSEELYISRGTIEKDLLEVEGLLKKEGVLLHKKPSKGIKLPIDERTKRELISIVIQDFWRNNWYLKQEGRGLIHSFDKIQVDVNGLLLKEGLEKMIEIVREFRDVQSIEFSDIHFQSIVIHLAITVERIRKGKYVEEEDRHYSNEIYQKAEPYTSILIKKLEEQFSIAIPTSEQDYINVHIATAFNQFIDSEERDAHTISRKIQFDRLSQIVKESIPIQSNDSLLVEGLTTHIQSAINRVKLGKNIRNPYTDKIKRTYIRSYEQALYLKEKIEDTYNILLDDNETAFISLHFEAYFERESESSNTLHTILISSMGESSTRLIAARIKKHFPTINIEKTLSVQEVMKEKLQADLVISTIYIELTSIPTIVVSPLMTQEDIQILRIGIIKNIDKIKKMGQSFVELVDDTNILLQLDVSSMEDVLYILGNHLIHHGYAKYGIVENTLKRELLSFTSFKDIATPHASVEYINKSTIIFSTLKNPIKWGNQKVDKVFFTALKKEYSLNSEEIYEGFYNYLDSRKKMNHLKKSKFPSDVSKNILGCGYLFSILIM